MTNENNAKVITLRDLWNIFIHRLVIIILAAGIVAGGFMAYDILTFVPQYTSTATLYIVRQNENMAISSGEASNEFSLALKMVNDCTYLLKSRTVVNQVINELDLDMSYSSLYSRISTSNPDNTRILEVSVQGNTPEEAKEIVDAICEIGQVKITEAMGFQQVNLYEYGAIPTTPSNRPSVVTYMVIGMVTAVLVYGIYLLAFLLDDRIRTDEDIERVLGLSILAEIPNVDGHGKKRYGYYRGYRYKGYGNRYGYGYGNNSKATVSEPKNEKEKRG